MYQCISVYNDSGACKWLLVGQTSHRQLQLMTWDFITRALCHPGFPSGLHHRHNQMDGWGERGLCIVDFVLKSEFVFYNVGKKSASNCGEKMSLNNFMASPNSTTRKTQEIYSQREIYINQMGVVSSILRPFPLPDLAFSTPLLNLGSKIYEVFLRGRGVLCFIIWGVLHSAILPQLRHRTKKKHLASQH